MTIVFEGFEPLRPASFASSLVLSLVRQGVDMTGFLDPDSGFYAVGKCRVIVSAE